DADHALIAIERMDLVDIDFDWPTKGIVAKAGFKRLAIEIERSEDGTLDIVKAFGGPAAPTLPNPKHPLPPPPPTPPTPPRPPPGAARAAGPRQAQGGDRDHGRPDRRDTPRGGHAPLHRPRHRPRLLRGLLEDGSARDRAEQPPRPEGEAGVHQHGRRGWRP